MLRLALRLTLLLLCALLPGRAWAAVDAPSEIRVTGEAAENCVKGLEAQLVYCTYRAALATPQLRRGNRPFATRSASGPLFRWKGRWWSDFGGPDGTYDMRARVWSPELGIFLSADDFGFHDANGTLWSWPNQNPVNLSDPSGNLGENNGAGTLPWFLRGIEGLNNFDMGVRTRAQGIDLMHNESTFELGLSMYICGSEQMVQGFGQTVETGGFIVNVADVVIGLGKAAAAMGGGSFISNGMGGGGGKGGRLSGKNPPISPRQALHTNGTPGKSQFKPTVNAEHVTRTAWEQGVPVFDKNGQFLGKRFTFEKAVGTSPSGYDQHSVFVHWSPNHGIHGVPTTVGGP